MKYGEHGKGISSRWYPRTLSRRILDIACIRKRIKFVQGDGLEYMEKKLGRRHACFFIDPPYVVAGRRLYRHSEIDHERLFALAKRIAGDFLITYDDSEEIRRLIIRFQLDCETVPMKSTHNTRMMELLISRNLHWLRSFKPPQQAFREFFPRTRQELQDALR